MFVSLKFTPYIVAAEDGSGHELSLHVRMEGYAGQAVVHLRYPEEHTMVLTRTETRDLNKPKRRKRISMKQEEEIAQMHGGHRNPGSGSVAGRAGDASIRGKYRIENKYTTGAGIRVTKADLYKIRSECERGQIPVFQIDFKEKNNLRTEDRWVLVPLEEWRKRIAVADDR